ncbi:uncharacterized protein BDV14DRAFT_184927 [Aspergillus stella-maris]|uniref:uncharacterized protein n=1 Tax=Aspergillus stella-maris TaxID=1810926 RepID=UPI003CCD0BE9
MVDFTRPTKPNTRIPPILLARKHHNQTQPSISTSPPSQSEQATHIINLSQRKLSAESNNADPSLRRCLAHHRLLTKSIFEAKSDMKVYFDEVEYESDSEDEEDEDAVFDEHVEVVGTFHMDNDNVRVVDEESDAEAMLFHEEPTVHQEEAILSHLNPPPGLPIPSNMAVTMPMSMPVSAYTPTSTASTLTHHPRPKTSRLSFSSKIDPTSGIAPGDQKASNGLAASVEPSAGRVSSDVIPNSNSSPNPSNPALCDEVDKSTTDTAPTPMSPRPPLSSLPSFTPVNRTSSAPEPTSTSTSPAKTPHPIKSKIVNTVKGLVKRRNSSPSCLPMPSIEPTTTSPTSAEPTTADSKPTEVPATRNDAVMRGSRTKDEEKENSPPLLHLSGKNASCSSIPVRIKVHEDVKSGDQYGRGLSVSSGHNTQLHTNTHSQNRTFAKRGKQYAQRLGERVGVAVPVTT